jgi:hypothetical protein
VQPLVEAGVEQGHRVGAGGPPLRAEADRPAPAGPQRDAPPAEGGDPFHFDVGSEDLAAEHLDVVGRDPRGSQSGGDLARFQLSGQHSGERGDVAFPARIGLRQCPTTS